MRCWRRWGRTNWNGRIGHEDRLHRAGEHGGADGAQPGGGRARGVGLRSGGGGRRRRVARDRGGRGCGERGRGHHHAAERADPEVGCGAGHPGDEAGRDPVRLLDRGRGQRARGRGAGGGGGVGVAGRARLGRYRRGGGGDADLHGGRQRRCVRDRATAVRDHGPEGGPLRRGGRGPGGQDLQQHDPGRDDGRHMRGVRAGAETRSGRAEAVRRGVHLVGVVVVHERLLPGAGGGAEVACRQRLPPRLRGRADAEGPAAVATGRDLGRCGHADGAARDRALHQLR